MRETGTHHVDEAANVMLAAELLELTEFELFRAAYQAWHRESASEAHIERQFVPYMFEGKVPFWVRQFTRTTLDAHGVCASCEEPSLLDMLRMGCQLCEATVRTLRLMASLFAPPFALYDATMPAALAA